MHNLQRGNGTKFLINQHLEDYILNDVGDPPVEYLESQYRRRFGLTTWELENEPEESFQRESFILLLESKREKEELDKARKS